MRGISGSIGRSVTAHLCGGGGDSVNGGRKEKPAGFTQECFT
jgi:hypothetical protein